MPRDHGPPPFDGTDYAYWKARMQAYLEALDPLAWEVVSTGVSLRTPIGTLDVNLAKANAKAKNALFEAITKEVFARVKSAGTAHEVWTQIQQIHEGSKDVKE